MANTKISQLPTFVGNTTGSFVVLNDSGNTTTYKVTRETLFTGSLEGTASYSSKAISSSYATTASYWSGSITNALSSSYATTASYWSGSITNVSSASYASTASYASNFTASNLLVTGSLNVSGSIGARLYQLSDVNDNVTSSADGYYLTYNSGSQTWYTSAGAATKGSVRLYIATNRSNASAFYFNANTRTASDSPSPTADTAFMVTTNLLSRVTVYLRQDNAGPNATVVGVAKNADGTAFSTAALVTSSSLSLGQNTVQTWQFSGLSINTFDTLHIYCDPTSTPGTLYGIVIID